MSERPPDQAARNQALFDRMRAATGAEQQKLRNKLIEENIPLVKYLVQQLVTQWPAIEAYRDDLTSEGYMALIEAIDNLLTKDDANVTGFIAEAINRRIDTFQRENTTIRVPASTHRKKRIDPPVCTGSIDLDSLADDVDREPLGLMNQIDMACETDDERRIVSMLGDGKTQTEVADELGISQSAVSRIVAEVYARLAKIVHFRKPQIAAA